MLPTTRRPLGITLEADPRGTRPNGMLAARERGIGRIRRAWPSSSESWSGDLLPRPRWNTSGSRRPIALAVFSSDAISSTAYATEEILFVVATGASSLGARAQRARADRHHGRGPAVDRRHLVSTDDLRLPERRWQLRRESREPRREPVAHRRCFAARRLHPHRRGVDLRRRRGDRVDSRAPSAWRSTEYCSGWY